MAAQAAEALEHHVTSFVCRRERKLLKLGEMPRLVFANRGMFEMLRHLRRIQRPALETREFTVRIKGRYCNSEVKDKLARNLRTLKNETLA